MNRQMKHNLLKISHISPLLFNLPSQIEIKFRNMISKNTCTYVNIFKAVYLKLKYNFR